MSITRNGSKLGQCAHRFSPRALGQPLSHSWLSHSCGHYWFGLWMPIELATFSSNIVIAFFLFTDLMSMFGSSLAWQADFSLLHLAISVGSIGRTLGAWVSCQVNLRIIRKIYEYTIAWLWLINFYNTWQILS